MGIFRDGWMKQPQELFVRIFRSRNLKPSFIYLLQHPQLKYCEYVRCARHFSRLTIHPLIDGWKGWLLYFRPCYALQRQKSNSRLLLLRQRKGVMMIKKGSSFSRVTYFSTNGSTLLLLVLVASLFMILHFKQSQERRRL